MGLAELAGMTVITIGSGVLMGNQDLQLRLLEAGFDLVKVGSTILIIGSGTAYKVFEWLIK